MLYNGDFRKIYPHISTKTLNFSRKTKGMILNHALIVLVANDLLMQYEMNYSAFLVIANNSRTTPELPHMMFPSTA